MELGQEAAWLRQGGSQYSRRGEEEVSRDEFQLVDAHSGEEVWSRTEELTQRNLRTIDLRAWSPDGGFIAVTMASQDNQAQLELWDAATGKTLATLTRPTTSIVAYPTVAFSPDSRMLADGADDEIHVWDLPELSDPTAEPVSVGAPALSLPNSHGRLRALTFSRNGREIRAVTGAAIKTWDATMRNEPKPLPQTQITGGELSSDATRLAIVNQDREVSVWNVSTGQLICELSFGRQRSGIVGQMAFSHDSRQLALDTAQFGFARRLDEKNVESQRQSQICLFDSQDGHLLDSFTVRPESALPTSIPMAGQICFRSDDRQLAIATPPSTNHDGAAELHVWDVQKHAELPPVELPWRSARVLGCTSDAAKWIVAEQGNGTRQVATVDAETGALGTTHDFPGEACYSSSLCGAAWQSSRTANLLSTIWPPATNYASYKALRATARGPSAPTHAACCADRSAFWQRGMPN